jgi:hypothetical protein
VANCGERHGELDGEGHVWCWVERKKDEAARPGAEDGTVFEGGPDASCSGRK